MKKTYTKPEISFESFVMSTNIAGDCEKPFVNNASKGSCPVLGSGGLAIFDGLVGAACNAEPAEKDTWNGLCYHVPTEAANLFNS